MSTIIPKGSIIASFVYEKSNNLKGYKEMDDMTIKEVIKNEGYLGHEVFSKNEKYIFIGFIISLREFKQESFYI